jgi:hypothetical protein
VSILSILIPWLVVVEPSPCLNGELAYKYAMHLRHLLETTEPQERKGFGLERATPDSLTLEQDQELCGRAREAYNGRRTETWQHASAVVGVYWVGSARVVVVDGDHPDAHYRDWMVYDAAFRKVGGFVN